MLTFEKFSGLNNVLPIDRLGDAELSQAVNVDIGLSGEVTRRAGYTEVSALCHKNIWQGKGFMLATCNGDLVKTVGGTQTVLYPSLGVSRVWYANLPDGRTTFTNGLINGITDGNTVTKWGVPLPGTVGAFTDIAGALFPGKYQYQVSYVRLADGQEGGTTHAAPIDIVEGGLFLSGLPTLAGHKINVYLTGADGDKAYLAGSTLSGAFSYIGKNDALTLPVRTEFLYPAPVGTITAVWRDRLLVAVGGVLYASMPHMPELFNLSRDFKQFPDDITLVQGVDDGLYIGTTTELAFLPGAEFDKLQYRQVIAGPVVLGSGVEVPGDKILVGQQTGDEPAMICIADQVLVAGFKGGVTTRLSEGTYRTSATEVAATFRVQAGIPQYIAVPQ